MKAKDRAKTVLVCDFDDTIVSPDTGVVILDRFAEGDWRTLDKLYNSNRMPVEEVIRRQFAMVRATKNAMIQEVERSVTFRPGFEELVRTCDQRRLPVVVASYGLDFCIEHLLRKAGVKGRIQVHAPRTRLGPNGIGFSFPRHRLKDSVNLKHDMVRQYKVRGHKVAFVGDGASDFPAVKAADLRFAIKGSALAGLCDRDRIQHSRVTSFSPVTRAIVSL